jgi:hypothetical protein
MFFSTMRPNVQTVDYLACQMSAFSNEGVVAAWKDLLAENVVEYREAERAP